MARKMILLDCNVLYGTKRIVLAGTIAGAMLTSQIFTVNGSAQVALPAQAAPTQSAAPAAKPSQLSHSARYRPNPFAGRAGRYYALFWGIDSPSVKAVESGELIRFTYRVLDPEKAKAINDKKNDAFLIFPDAMIRLSVPSLEKVGQLRQSSTPESGKTYWMAFSNPGRRVKRGDRVNVVIGNFHAEGLVVE
jgi:hypothetical protein